MLKLAPGTSTHTHIPNKRTTTSSLVAYYYFSNYLADVVILGVIYLLGGKLRCNIFVCMQLFHRHGPAVTATVHPLARSCGHQSVSQSDSEVGTTAGGGPGSGLGSSSGTGADRAFRILKSETMKRVDHKR